MVNMTLQVPVPILLAREGRWYVASCPILNIATQGRTEKEVKENLADLIREYLRDPDTSKPSLDELMSLSLANIPVRIPERMLRGKASTATSA
jgi:predicted RNase H-like HicB family nuclease